MQKELIRIAGLSFLVFIITVPAAFFITTGHWGNGLFPQIAYFFLFPFRTIDRATELMAGGVIVAFLAQYIFVFILLWILKITKNMLTNSNKPN
jgi:hypothetical protein